jgi:hypothetical protein
LFESRPANLPWFSLGKFMSRIEMKQTFPSAAARISSAAAGISSAAAGISSAAAGISSAAAGISRAAAGLSARHQG